MIVRTALMIDAPPFNNDEVRELVASPKDFKGLQEVFNNPGIGDFGRVSVMEGNSIGLVKKEIKHFYANREHHELLLMYITGYELIEKDEHIYFVDKHRDLNDLEETGISARFIHDEVKACKADKKILIIDCFSRDELDAEHRHEKEVRLADFSRDTHSFVLTSQDTVGTIFTNSGVKSPGFSESLLEGLKTGDADLDGRGFISEDELFIYVYKRMNKHGLSPNLFLGHREEGPSIRIARNIKFARFPEFAKEDSAINFGRYFRLIGRKKNMDSHQEKESLDKIIQNQPESTFLKRLLGAALIVAIISLLGGFLLNIPLGKATILGFIVFAGLILQIFIGRFIN